MHDSLGKPTFKPSERMPVRGAGAIALETAVVNAVFLVVLVLVGISHGSAAPDPYARALELHRAGDPEAAREFYEQVLKRDTNHYGALYGLAGTWFDARNYHRARRGFKDCLVYHPRDLQARLMLGESELNLGLYEEAQRTFSRILEVDPNHVDAMIGLAKAEYFQGNRFSGERRFQQALKADPKNEYLQETVLKVREANRRYLQIQDRKRRMKLLQALNEALNTMRIQGGCNCGRPPMMQ